MKNYFNFIYLKIITKFEDFEIWIISYFDYEKQLILEILVIN